MNATLKIYCWPIDLYNILPKGYDNEFAQFIWFKDLSVCFVLKVSNNQYPQFVFIEFSFLSKIFIIKNKVAQNLENCCNKNK